MAFSTPLDVIDAIANWLTSLSPAILEWLNLHKDEIQEHATIVSLKRCYRLCKHEKLSDAMVQVQVNILFLNMTQEQRVEITLLMLAWLKK